MNLVVQYNQSGSKVSSMLPHEQDNFLLSLRKVATAHGVTVTADDVEMVNAFIRKMFPDLTQFEIVYAFELYAAERIVIERKKEWNANFNIEFVGAVLNAYKEYRRPILDENEKRIESEKQLQAPKPEEINWRRWQEERGLNFHKFLEGFVLNEKKMPVAADFMFEAAFDYMTWNKIIPEMSKKEKANFAADIRDGMMARIEQQRFMQYITHEQFKEAMVEIDDKKKFGEICRAERARQYYRELLQEQL